ncbi:hypothetical protein [Shewanella surugensis]|uniref:Uncharacterized protein n=1 Tax=Shewanella surugensis TaxID=212020 RepID=A0ABT0LAP1_9GAMM|nr:hypothetical protein [Shewanella surugensis]MCL1124773.1 hypothetical protein [Shewanella surugensis]
MNYHTCFKRTAIALICSSSCFSYANTLPEGGKLKASPAPFEQQFISERVLDELDIYSENTYFTIETHPIEVASGAIKQFKNNTQATQNSLLQVRTLALGEDPIEEVQPEEPLNTITPMCTTLVTDNLYTLGGLTAGQASCYHFEITESSKTTIFVSGQSAETDINLTVYQHNEDDSLSVIGTSTNTGNTNEVVLGMLTAGHYYWYMDTVLTDGTDINFAAVTNTNFDSYELNDTIATSTVLADKQNIISGNMDSNADADYYHFTSTRGQDVTLGFSDTYGNNEWVAAIFTGSEWQTLTNGLRYNLSTLQANQIIRIRVTANTSMTADTSHNYTLMMGSKVAQLSAYSVEGESNIARMSYSATPVYMTTQAARKLSWSASLLDSTGAPVEGAEIVLRVEKNFNEDSTELNYINHSLISNIDGKVNGIVDLGSCTGNFESAPYYSYAGSQKVWWEARYNFGMWRLEVPGVDGIGVGGDEVPYVTLAHICSSRLL